MARLTESRAAALVAALTRESGVYAAASADEPDLSAWHPAEGVEPPVATPGEDGAPVDQLRSLARDRARLDELGRTLTLDLAAYLRRPVRCSAAHAAPAIPSAWRFGVKIRGGTVWLDVDIALAAALGDAMIGGDGTAAIGRGRRVRALASVAVRRMLDAVAAAASIELHGATETLAPDPAFGNPIAGGMCAVAVEEFPWALGAFAESPALAERAPAPLADRAAVAAAPSVPTPAAGAGVAHDPDAALAGAIDALNARLAELTHAKVAASAAKVERIDGAEVAGPPSAALGLALSAGGNGVVVAFADAAAVTGIAFAASGATPIDASRPGEVVVAAAEAVLRDALERAALRLPALGGEGHRVVRLSDDPLAARTPHHAVDVRLSIDGRSGTLRVLVPSWMLSHREKRTR